MADEEKTQDERLGAGRKVTTGTPSPFRPTLDTIPTNVNPLPQDQLYPADSPHHV